jgi:RTX calcium-binding nonapeptide repeat (4 copies)
MRVFAVALGLLLLGAAAAGARTIVGTPGNDRLVGTPRADNLFGRAGNDRITGLAGADLVAGGAGRDSIDAGAGADRISIEYDGARDSAHCGAGADVVNADLVDTVSADCELVGRRLSRDPYTNPESQHESEVEPDSFTFGRTTVATYQVGRRFDGAATNIGYAVTNDDARTWTSGLLPGLTIASVPSGPNARASDPVVAYDAAHRVWMISTLALDVGTTRLAINRSADGSRWDSALVAAEEVAAEGIAFDKNWITCDNSATSPFYGRCYLLYTHSSDEDMLAVTSTTDGGLTWSSPTNLGVRPAVGVFPVVRPTGELVAVYLWEARPFVIAASRSTDGGASFAPPVQIAGVDTSSCSTRGLRAFSLPSADVAADGRVWATWHDCRLADVRTNDIFVSSSADGSAWTAATPITAGRDGLLPAIGIDAGSGRIAIAYLRNRSAGVDAELVESQGGTRWSSPKRLSAQSMPLTWMPDTTSGRMLGDYISVHYASGRPLVVWVLASEPVGSSLRQAVYATKG